VLRQRVLDVRTGQAVRHHLHLLAPDRRQPARPTIFTVRARSRTSTTRRASRCRSRPTATRRSR
jgi:hypothetical protein